MPDPRSVFDRLELSPEVRDALAAGHPVVALESTLISHGLPYPQNLEVARASEAAVRESGATPATVAVHRGRLLVGLDPTGLEALATAPAGSVRKAARPSLAAALAESGWAATTVSATMIAAHAAGIRVFATGGIGGVHRGALGAGGGAGHQATLDISSDLEELARTPMAVVCAGPKAILDVPATLEYLETRGVPVIAIGQDELPGFFARSARIRAPGSVPDVRGAAEIVATQLGLGLGAGIVVCVAVPADDALPDEAARVAVDRAIRDADEAGIAGPELTPWLLARVATLTAGASVRANTALIVNDARVAGQLATLLGG
ncbi:MAG TPA: pseudouridine-5'-phosphate glycosidase [Candidatus Limnocylindrales bacterium]